jgi:putative transposase
MIDLPLKNSSSIDLDFRPIEHGHDEEASVHGRADRRDFAGAGGRAKTADLARKYAVSLATLYNFKAKFGGPDVSEAKRLKALEEESARLKKLLADQMLDAAALCELLSKKNARARREARSRRADSGRHGPVGASGLFHRRYGPQDRSLFAPAAGGRKTAQKLRDLADVLRRFGYRRLVRFAAARGRDFGHEPHASTGSTARKC